METDIQKVSHSGSASPHLTGYHSSPSLRSEAEAWCSSTNKFQFTFMALWRAEIKLPDFVKKVNIKKILKNPNQKSTYLKN